jgi:hypothetical protein
MLYKMPFTGGLNIRRSWVGTAPLISLMQCLLWLISQCTTNEQPEQEIRNPDKGVSGCGFEIVAGLKVALGFDRVDLVGGKGRDDVNESVDDGSMLGKVEGRELLDMADDGLGHVPRIKQGVILRRYGQWLHVLADAGEQRETATQQLFGQLLADIALVAEELAGQVAGQCWDRLGVMDIIRG